MKFYICESCGNIITFLNDTGIPVMCCGMDMEELIPNSSNAAEEKHMPVVTVDNNKVIVEIGTVEHPMTEGHFIEWIIVETTKGVQSVKLSHTDKPKAEFELANDAKLIAVYGYCNLHGLWKKQLYGFSGFDSHKEHSPA